MGCRGGGTSPSPDYVNQSSATILVLTISRDGVLIDQVLIGTHEKKHEKTVESLYLSTLLHAVVHVFTTSGEDGQKMVGRCWTPATLSPAKGRIPSVFLCLA